uniref:Uncharacterized protein n=1 Tax=Arundo donax TaxID=35708 RepID=A0A0A9BMI7_ARUDO
MSGTRCLCRLSMAAWRRRRRTQL